MSCNSLCCVCKIPQDYKINFSKYHGVCKAHSNPKTNFLFCSMCSSLLPVLLKIELKVCENCIKSKECRELKCSHLLCSDCCPNEVCKICEESLEKNELVVLDIENKENEKIVGDSTENLIDESTKPTKELIQEAELKCEYCFEQVAISRGCTHLICDSCFIHECPLSLKGSFISNYSNLPETDSISKQEKDSENFVDSTPEIQDKVSINEKSVTSNEETPKPIKADNDFDASNPVNVVITSDLKSESAHDENHYEKVQDLPCGKMSDANKRLSKSISRSPDPIGKQCCRCEVF